MFHFMFCYILLRKNNLLIWMKFLLNVFPINNSYGSKNILRNFSRTKNVARNFTIWYEKSLTRYIRYISATGWTANQTREIIKSFECSLNKESSLKVCDLRVYNRSALIIVLFSIYVHNWLRKDYFVIRSFNLCSLMYHQ